MPQARATVPSHAAVCRQFTLHKVRISTLDAITALGAALGVPPSTFAVAGLKDSFAMTTQRVTCRNSFLTTEEVQRAAMAVPRIAVEDFSPSWVSLQIGHSAGNRFRLVVRDIAASSASACEAADLVCAHGFVNYYGLQRAPSLPSLLCGVGRTMVVPCNGWVQLYACMALRCTVDLAGSLRGYPSHHVPPYQ